MGVLEIRDRIPIIFIYHPHRIRGYQTTIECSMPVYLYRIFSMPLPFFHRLVACGSTFYGHILDSTIYDPQPLQLPRLPFLPCQMHTVECQHECTNQQHCNDSVGVVMQRGSLKSAKVAFCRKEYKRNS